MKLSISTLTPAILSLTTLAFAGGNTQTNTIPPTTSQVIEKFGDKLDQYMGALASKAGVAADHFYPIFVRQQVITGVTELLLLGMGAIVAYLLIRMGIANGRLDDAEDKSMFGYFAGTAIGIIIFFNVMIMGSDAISKICNPEFYAVQNLIQMVK